jgi:hypothetical protein
VLSLESLLITKSFQPNAAHQSLRQSIALLSSLVTGYLLPSFTLNRNEWGQRLGIGGHEGWDSHSAVVKPPKMKSSVVSAMVRVQPFPSQHRWKSSDFHPSVVAS